MQNRLWNDVELPPAEITPCGRLTDTPQRFYESACHEAERVQSLHLEPKSRILDIGCGVGRLPIGLLATKAAFGSYLGIDVDDARVRWCQTNLSARDKRLAFRKSNMKNERYNPQSGNSLDYNLSADSHDIAYAYSLFSHLTQPHAESVLAAVAGALTQTGQFFVTVFVANGVADVTENPPDFAPLPWSGRLHCVLYDRDNWLRLVTAAGLHVLREMPGVNIDGQTGYVLAKTPKPHEVSRPTQAAGKCLVGFFGVLRDVSLTSISIRENIFEPLRRANWRCTIVGHLNHPTILHSPRSRERGTAPRLTGLSALQMELSWLEPQNAGHISQMLESVRNVPWRDEADADLTMRKNALHQLYSLHRLWQLAELFDRREFDMYCFLRSDLLYIDAIPVASIVDRLRSGVDIVTPSWHRFGGLNDRFAFCARSAADVYLRRIDTLLDHCRKLGWFHPESLLHQAMESAGLKSDFTPVRAWRVRATGEIKDEDFSVVH